MTEPPDIVFSRLVRTLGELATTSEMHTTTLEFVTTADCDRALADMRAFGFFFAESLPGKPLRRLHPAAFNYRNGMFVRTKEDTQ